MNNSTWEREKKFVLEKIEEHNDEIRGLDKGQRDFTYLIIKRINQFELRITERVAKLETSFKIKSGVFGVVGGAIPVCLVLMIWFLKSQM